MHTTVATLVVIRMASVARARVSWINPCIRRVCSSVRVDPFGLLGEGFMEFCMLEYQLVFMLYRLLGHFS